MLETERQELRIDIKTKTIDDLIEMRDIITQSIKEKENNQRRG